MRVGPNGTLFVADAYLGLFEVDPTTGELSLATPPPPPAAHLLLKVNKCLCAGAATKLVSGGQVVAGRKLSFINDLTVTQDGKKVYFTDSSSRWQRRNFLYLIMEATADGRYCTTSTIQRGRVLMSKTCNRLKLKVNTMLLTLFTCYHLIM